VLGKVSRATAQRRNVRQRPDKSPSCLSLRRCAVAGEKSPILDALGLTSFAEFHAATHPGKILWCNFDLLRELGNVSDSEMYRTFNMGIGMVVFLAPSDLSRAAELWKAAGQRWFAIGNVRGGGERRVVVEPGPQA